MTLIGILIVAGGVFLSQRVTLLQLGNLDRPRQIRVRISFSEGFSIFHRHFTYREPVVEEFQIEGNAFLRPPSIYSHLPLLLVGLPVGGVGRQKVWSEGDGFLLTTMTGCNKVH